MKKHRSSTCTFAKDLEDSEKSGLVATVTINTQMPTMEVADEIYSCFKDKFDDWQFTFLKVTYSIFISVEQILNYSGNK